MGDVFNAETSLPERGRLHRDHSENICFSTSFYSGTGNGIPGSPVKRV